MNRDPLPKKSNSARLFFGWTALLAVAVMAEAHQILIAPVIVTVERDGSMLHASIQANAVFWIMEVLNKEPPPAEWPEAARQKSLQYLQEHFVLNVDGIRKTPTLVTARHIQEPWQQLKDSTVAFQLRYELPADPQRFNGEIIFYKEELEEARQHKEKDRVAQLESHAAVLMVVGQSPQKMELLLKRPAFSFTATDLKKSALTCLLERSHTIVSTVFATPPLFILIVGGLGFFGYRRFSRVDKK